MKIKQKIREISTDKITNNIINLTRGSSGCDGRDDNINNNHCGNTVIMMMR